MSRLEGGGLARASDGGTNRWGPGANVGFCEPQGSSSPGELAYLDWEVVIVVVGAAEGERIVRVGGQNNRQLCRLPPPPVLDPEGTKISQASLHCRRAEDLREVGRGLLAGVEGRDMSAPDCVLNHLLEASGLMVLCSH